MTTISAPTRIEVFRPAVGDAEIRAVAEVLRSGWIGRGPQVAALEQAWADHLGVPAEHVVSLNCATEALFQVMDYLRNYPGVDALVLPANSYIGTANAARVAGIGIRLCDVDRRTLNPTPESIWSVSEPTDAFSADDTLAVVVQHYGGVPSQISEIATLCRDKGMVLIEDCACAPGAWYAGRRAGLFGSFSIWSFDAMKVITAADGAMLYCRSVAAAAFIRAQTLLGQDSFSGRDAGGARWWEFNVRQPGRRAVMNDLEAAIGLVQLGRMHDLVAARQALWHRYQRALAGMGWLTLPPEPLPGVRSSYYTYWVQCDRRDELASWLRERGIYTTYRYWPVHQAYGWESQWPNTDWAAAHTLNLPLYPSLRDSEQDCICDALAEFGRTR